MTTKRAIERLLSPTEATRWTFGQLLLQRHERHFEARHVADAQRGADELRTVQIEDLRDIGTYTTSGAFRPLRVAPDLQTGWRVAHLTLDGLEQVIHRIYPGALADWSAVEIDGVAAHAQGYRDFVNRQTGMYRLTQTLTDAEAADTAKACCDPRFCLKRRVWVCPGMPPQTVESTSVIPCLEPCATLMELARVTARNRQQDQRAINISSTDLSILVSALERAVDDPDPNVRVGEVAAQSNPRRIRLLIESLHRQTAQEPDSQSEDN